MPQLKYSDEEVVRQGQTLYEKRIQSRIDERDRGKFLVLDIETGDYELDSNELQALKRAKAKRPDAVLYMLRIGYPATYRLGRRGAVAPA